jgi:hypothetical protein
MGDSPAGTGRSHLCRPFRMEFPVVAYVQLAGGLQLGSVDCRRAGKHHLVGSEGRRVVSAAPAKLPPPAGDRRGSHLHRRSGQLGERLDQRRRGAIADRRWTRRRALRQRGGGCHREPCGRGGRVGGNSGSRRTLPGSGSQSAARGRSRAHPGCGVFSLVESRSKRALRGPTREDLAHRVQGPARQDAPGDSLGCRPWSAGSASG